MGPVPVMAFMHLGPLPVWAKYIIGIGNKWCQYRYWHNCTLSSTSIGMVYYRYCHYLVPVPVLAFWYFGSVSVLARSITGTGIKWCQYWYWHFCTLVQSPVLAWYITGTGIKRCPYRYWHLCILVQYQYRHGTLPVQALNVARTGIGTFALWSSTSMGVVHYRYWH